MPPTLMQQPRTAIDHFRAAGHEMATYRRDQAIEHVGTQSSLTREEFGKLNGRNARRFRERNQIPLACVDSAAKFRAERVLLCRFPHLTFASDQIR